MAKTGKPRSGSLQFWPRKRAKRAYAIIKAKPQKNDLFGFAGYKVGMTNVSIIDNRKHSTTKNESINIPVTIVECPPLKIFSVRFYKKTLSGLSVQTEILAPNLNKNLTKKIVLPKKQNKKLEDVKQENYDSIALIFYTQPQLAGFGKKKPEMFELKLGGSKEDQINFVKEKLNKEINVSDVFTEGQQLDVHGVTKGKGTSGPVKRFGVSIRSHKSEKTKRGPGSLGPWLAHGKIMWRVAYAGQHGYHQRTEYNKWLIKIGKEASEIIPKSGFRKYGLIKTDYLLIKGSIAGPKKRLLIFTEPQRPNKKVVEEAPIIEHIRK